MQVVMNFRVYTATLLNKVSYIAFLNSFFSGHITNRDEDNVLQKEESKMWLPKNRSMYIIYFFLKIFKF